MTSSLKDGYVLKLTSPEQYHQAGGKVDPFYFWVLGMYQYIMFVDINKQVIGGDFNVKLHLLIEHIKGLAWVVQAPHQGSDSYSKDTCQPFKQCGVVLGKDKEIYMQNINGDSVKTEIVNVNTLNIFVFFVPKSATNKTVFDVLITKLKDEYREVIRKSISV